MQSSTTTLPPLLRAGEPPAGTRADDSGMGTTPAGAWSARQSAAELQIDVVASLDGLTALGPEWNGLFERAGQPHHVFQTFGFASLWARHFIGRHDCGCTLAILTARRHGRLVMVWPMVQQRQARLKVLTWLGAPVAQYGDVLIDPSVEQLLVLRAAWAHLQHALAPDVLRLRKVRADASIAPLLGEMGTRISEPVEAPYVTLRAGGSAVEDRQSGKAKKNRRRLLRRLEEQGKVEFLRSAGDDAAPAIIAAGLDAKRDWLLRRGLMSPAIADPKLDGLLTAAATTDAEATGCRLFTLQLEGKTVAVAMGFICKRRLMMHFITQTADVERYGAGVLNLEAILRQAEAEGLEAVDLLPPKADYKLDWSDGAVPVADHALGCTIAGKILTLAFDQMVRPRLKRSLEALPLRVRKRMAAFSLGLKSTSSA